MLLLITSSHPLIAQPFLTQDQNPFSLIHGQPQPVAAQLPEANTAVWSLSLDITNTLNIESSSTEKLLIDFESYNLRYSLLYGLDENWAVKIELPLIHYGGGFLDNTIDSWHEFFHLPRADRPYVINDQFLISYTQNGQALINLNTVSSGPGDIPITFARKLFQHQHAALSLWLSFDLSTGEQSNLTSNERSDLSLWLAGDYRFNPEWSVDSNIGILLPGESHIENLRVEDQVFFAYTGIQWQVLANIDLRIQLNGHTGFYSNSDLRLLSDSYNISFGGRIHMSDCSDIDVAVSEDIKVGATADVSFLFSWKSRLDCQ